MIIESCSVVDFINLIYKDDTDNKEKIHELYKKLKTFIKNHDVCKIPLLNNPDVAFIAGGLIRTIFFSQIHIPCVNMKLKDLISYGLTDIDIFYNSRESLIETQTKLKAFDVFHASHAAISYEVINFTDVDRFTIICQHVICRTGSPKEVLNDFDIINAQMALNMYTDTIWYNPDIFELEKTKTLSLNVENPRIKTDKFLLQRIHKYVTKKGFKKFNEENNSLKFFIEWCKNNLTTEDNCSRLLPSLLKNWDIVPVDFLSLFMGLSFSKLRVDYSSLTIDSASHAILHRNQKK